MLISSTLDSVGPSCRASARSLELVKGEGRGAVPAALVPNHVAGEVCCSEGDQGGDPWLCPDTFTDTREDELCSWFEAHEGEKGCTMGCDPCGWHGQDGEGC